VFFALDHMIGGKHNGLGVSLPKDAGGRLPWPGRNGYYRASGSLNHTRQIVREGCQRVALVLRLRHFDLSLMDSLPMSPVLGAYVTPLLVGVSMEIGYAAASGASSLVRLAHHLDIRLVVLAPGD